MRQLYTTTVLGGKQYFSILPYPSIHRRRRILFYPYHLEVHAHAGLHPADEYRDGLAADWRPFGKMGTSLADG